MDGCLRMTSRCRSGQRSNAAALVEGHKSTGPKDAHVGMTVMTALEMSSGRLHVASSAPVLSLSAADYHNTSHGSAGCRVDWGDWG